MIKNLQLIQRHAQLKELGSPLKYALLKELIPAPATCQQLAKLFDQSKQKIHYNLNKMLKEGLLELEEAPQSGNREVYYRATAKAYVLDLSIGLEANGNLLNSRAIINGIMEQNHRIDLSRIAAKLIDEAFRLKPGERFVVVSGKFNFPLVEKLMLEAGRRGIHCTLIYQDLETLQAKYKQYSLAAFKADYEELNRQLRSADMYLNLNGEARFVELRDPQKLALRNRMLEKSKQIIRQRGIRVAMMPGLLQDTLSEGAIQNEIQFWQALDIDYPKLCRQTLSKCRVLRGYETVTLSGKGSSLHFGIARIAAECGSFGDNEFQAPVINLPGGEILIVPKPASMHGTLASDRIHVCGEEVLRPVLRIENNEIRDFSAARGAEHLARAIESGGADGRKAGLICLGTNENIHLGDIDSALKHKSSGSLSVFWGDNRSLGGDVCGELEWFMQIEEPLLSFTDKR
ncbi:MAG: helix-turn-helix domain-containing protein [Candidatus Cloacimonetes bacterium]|nr:helix-turn-helix domain-containing protein [Candidatus Cloacimonadota bacterium]